ncbi:hypothetical protein M408DRAFT_332630 [Serendipita vermifera MAFF 305830]|uniref:Uncharacterized protein n=1 Tax=Serendipita vermifera MAFF 305830 TaxID=933852 RepID=A0A0C2X089_SERVB|nr:hypothetical protein M408DRAFT_332630 [Serendipita vermifera MAFF 305830]
MTTRNTDERRRGIPNTRLPRGRGRGGVSGSLNLGPGKLVHAIQAVQPTTIDSASSEAIMVPVASTSSAPVPAATHAAISASPKRLSRVDQLRGQIFQQPDSNGQLAPQSQTPAINHPLSLRGRRADAVMNALALTPNSSTLLVSPIGSSPAHGNKAERHSRSASRRRSLLNTRGPTLRSGIAYTPSKGADAVFYGDGTSTADSSMALSPMKLRGFGQGAENPADKSEVIGNFTVESIDPEESGEYTDDEDDDEDTWGMVDRMRLWRHDAMAQHLYETAVFWGDKILAWTKEPNDAFWLAQVHFQTGEYARAERLLTRPFSASQLPASLLDPDTDMQDDSPQSDVSGLPPTGGTESGIQSHLNHASHYAHRKDSFSTPLNPSVIDNGGALGLGRVFGGSLFSSSKRPNGAGIHDHDPFLSSAQASSKDKQPGLMMPPPPGVARRQQLPHQSDALLLQEAFEGDILRPMSIPGDEELLIPVVENEGSELDGEHGENVVRLVDINIMCRYLAAQCQVRQGKWSEALEVLGQENPFRDVAHDVPHVASGNNGIKVEASMCHLRGVLYMRLNRPERAKTCFLEAISLDVRCFESFNTLIQCQMLTVEEEWELVQGLRFQEQNPEDGEFIRLMYTTRVKKIKYAEQISQARKRLVMEYGLGANCDVLYTLADSLYAQLKFADCFVVTSRIMDISGIHLPTVPLHVACMYHLRHLHSRLFLLAHELVDKEPGSPTSWYAVGVWYLATNAWREAKQYLSKATLSDPRHAPGWIAFGHTFAKEGEHEHAITAYSTCARLFLGSHLPHLFIGMEHLTLSHLTLASEALEAAHSMCDSDPLVFNERGVVAYLQKDYRTAVRMFDTALDLARVSQGFDEHWVPTYCNLGTAHRKLGHFEEAKHAYRKVLLIEPRHANALASLGMVHHMCEEYQEAIQQYHEALSVDPLHSNVLELLNMALESGAAQSLKVPAISEKVAVATQILTEKETEYLKRSKENADEKVGWDMPFGEPSAWTV